MRRIDTVVLVVALLFATLFAQALADEPLTLEVAARAATAASADVITARNDLLQAESALQVSLADPLAVRLEQLQARHAMEAAQVALRNTQLRARLAVTTAYLAALEAEGALETAVLQHEIAVTSHEAQQLRFTAGAITALDLERARNALQVADSDLNAAFTGLELARAELASLTGRGIDELEVLAGAPAAETGTTDGLLERALGENAALLAAGRAVELAGARLAALDNAFTSRQETDAARAGLAASELRASEARRALELTLQGSHSAVQAAQARLTGMTTALETARTELEAQAARYEAGTISLLAFRQAEATHATAKAAERSALHALVLATLRLEQAVLGQ